MKWSLYQLLMVVLIVVFTWLMEYTSGDGVSQSFQGEWTAVHASFSTFFVVACIITFFYLILLFEAKKEKSFLNHSIWANMSKNCVVIGILSTILFMVGVTVGPLVDLVEMWRPLLYVFLIYFLLLVFLFIFSIEKGKQKNSKQHERSIHISFVWTLLLFFAVFFLF